MRDYLYQLINKKTVLLLGFGREGESTYKIIRKYFPDFLITIADKDENKINKSDVLKRDELVNLIVGEDYLKNINKFDVIIKTPGISLNNLKIVVNPNNITSQTNIFLNVYSKQVIGITGTKGKSTTSSLIFNIIHAYTNNSLLVGNIGIPPFDMIDMIDNDTIIVCEMSSHQLEYLSKSPHIAILLNLFQEHLDHYKDYKDYQLSKFNITKYQNEKDYFIFYKDDKLINSLINAHQSKCNQLAYSLNNKVENGAFEFDNKIWFVCNNIPSMAYDVSDKRYLKGDHNLLNIMAAIIACKLKQIPEEYIQKGINDFKGLEHRIEFVGKFNGIDYYNDSIATIPEATIEAVKTLKNVNTIILGGFDRGIDYSDLAVFLINSEIEHLLFIEKAGLRILLEIKKLNRKKVQQFYIVNTLAEAISIAQSKTKKNKTCLLSPAAASYGMFINFEERGTVFKQLVRGIENKYQ